MKHLFLVLCLTILFVQMTKAQLAKDYFSISSVSFNKEVYLLAWSSFSDSGYYKQEYLRKGDYLDIGYNKMILIEILQKNMSPKDLAIKKVQEIEKRKSIDHVSNSQMIENQETGEYLVDFLISDGEGDLYEWNVYRYKFIETSKGRAVMLFGFSLRSFKNADLSLDNFFPYFKKNRIELINKLGNYELPKIELANSN